MNISPLSELPHLECIDLYIEDGGKRVTVETEGLDLSGCKSLKYLRIRPTSKDLRFLGSVQLESLTVPFSGIESLDGLDTTKLIHLDLQHNKITCIEILRGASLARPPALPALECMEGNPIDPNAVEEIGRSWV